jgi:hypothetical protein
MLPANASVSGMPQCRFDEHINSGTRNQWLCAQRGRSRPCCAWQRQPACRLDRPAATAGFGNVTRGQGGWGITRFAVDGQTKESSRARCGAQRAEHTAEAGQQSPSGVGWQHSQRSWRQWLPSGQRQQPERLGRGPQKHGHGAESRRLACQLVILPGVKLLESESEPRSHQTGWLSRKGR